MKKNFLSLGFFLSVAFVALSAEAGPTYYLHLETTFTNQTPSQISKFVETYLTAPLHKSSADLIFSYSTQANDAGYFFFNLAVEAKNSDSPQALNNYMTFLEGKGFIGLPIRFQRVDHFVETASLQLGTYEEDEMDPFHKNFEIVRSFSLPDLSSWNRFSNEYGFALLGETTPLQSYLEKFIGDANDFSNFKKIMAKNNMIGIDPQVEVFLTDGTSLDSSFEKTAFIPFRFFRNCFAASHENGMCSH